MSLGKFPSKDRYNPRLSLNHKFSQPNPVRDAFMRSGNLEMLHGKECIIHSLDDLGRPEDRPDGPTAPMVPTHDATADLVMDAYTILVKDQYH